MIDFFATKNSHSSFKYNDDDNISNIISQNAGGTTLSDNNYNLFDNISEVMFFSITKEDFFSLSQCRSGVNGIKIKSKDIILSTFGDSNNSTSNSNNDNNTKHNFTDPTSYQQC